MCIDGNIGSGKSTVMEAVRQELGELVSTFPEPVHEWGDLLAAYYRDPKAHAFTLSVKILHSFCQMHSARPRNRAVHVFERCPGTSKNVFAAMNRDDGDLGAREWDVLADLHADLAWQPDVVIFLDTPSHICCERVAKRLRDCESAMTTQYVRRVEHMYSKYVATLPAARVVKVDGSLPPAAVAAKVVDIVRGLASACEGAPVHSGTQ